MHYWIDAQKKPFESIIFISTLIERSFKFIDPQPGTSSMTSQEEWQVGQYDAVMYQIAASG